MEPIAIADGLDSVLTHGVEEVGGGEELFDGFGEGVGVVSRGDETIVSVLDEFGGSAFVGDDAGEAGGMGLEDDVAECVGGAGEDEDVCGGVGGGQLDAREVTGEDGVWEFVFEVLAVGAVADEGESEVWEGVLCEDVVGFDEDIEVFFLGEATNEEEDELARCGSA